MKPAVTALTLGAMLTVGSVVFAQDAKPSCAEDLDVLRMVYATSRSNAETYLEMLARTDLKLKAVQAQLDAAQKKLKELEALKEESK